MKQFRRHKRTRLHPDGYVLSLVLITMLILTLIGFAILKAAEGEMIQTIIFQNEQIALSSAEAAYERAIYWMSDNPDLLLDMDTAGTSGTLSFPNSTADYRVQFYGFIGYRPVFEVTADGYCGTYHRSIRVYVAQTVSGWEMGMCRVPTDTDQTTAVYFVDGEVVDMPIHINSYADPKDSQRDIFISGTPQFLKSVSMEETRRSSGGVDKYEDVMSVFHDGISFEQPRSLISDEASVDKKIKWYEKTVKDQKPELILKPAKNNAVSKALPAVQLEFYVGTDGKGHVRITDDCTVRSYTASSDTWDYKVRPGTDATQFEKYPIYGYHYKPQDAAKQTDRAVNSIQVVADYGGHQAPSCGMIYVDGNVIVGSAVENASSPGIAQLNVVQGRVTVIAEGNIWLTNSLTVSDKDDDGEVYVRLADGMPALDNPNAVALFARGVIKVIDPGMVEELDGSGSPPAVSKMVYEPVGLKDSGYADGTWHRHLPDPLVVEAAITVGGGGWGAEHVQRGFSGGRKDTGTQDDLLVRGTLTELMRGVVGLTGSDGYLKQYYFDRRMLSGLIPGTVRLKGKFATVPGGWSDFRVDAKKE
jgi:hypothetical protein